MPTSVRAALVQTTWTGDKESMIKAHEEYAREAAAQGAKVVCFQELFYGPYFCQVQDAKFYEYAESVPRPDGGAVRRAGPELGMVMVLPVYEQEQPGVLYNTAAVIDADGTYLGKYRKTHIPHVNGFWEKFYFRPGNLGYPVFDTAVGRGRRLHLLRPALPGGLAGARPQRRGDRIQPVGHQSRPVQLPLEARAAAAAVANEYFVGTINRVGIEDLGDDDFYGTSYFVDPEGKAVGRASARTPRPS